MLLLLYKKIRTIFFVILFFVFCARHVQSLRHLSINSISWVALTQDYIFVLLFLDNQTRNNTFFCVFKKLKHKNTELFVDFYLMLQHLLVVDSYFYLVFLCVLLYKCNMPFLPALIVFPLNFVKKIAKYVYMYLC